MQKKKSLLSRTASPLRIIKQFFQHLFQRIFRGWDDRETWNVDYEFFKWVLPRLKRYRELSDGYPPDTTPEKWDVELHNAAVEVEFILKHYFDCDAAIEPKVAALKIGFLVWWAKRCGNLWW